MTVLDLYEWAKERDLLDVPLVKYYSNFTLEDVRKNCPKQKDMVVVD